MVHFQNFKSLKKRRKKVACKVIASANLKLIKQIQNTGDTESVNVWNSNHVSNVTSNMSFVIRNISTVTNAISQSHTYFQTMHTKLAHKDTTKTPEDFFLSSYSLKWLKPLFLAICSLTRSLQLSWFLLSMVGTIYKQPLHLWIGLGADSVKSIIWETLPLQTSNMGKKIFWTSTLTFAPIKG